MAVGTRLAAAGAGGTALLLPSAPLPPSSLPELPCALSPRLSPGEDAAIRLLAVLVQQWVPCIFLPVLWCFSVGLFSKAGQSPAPLVWYSVISLSRKQI